MTETQKLPAEQAISRDARRQELAAVAFQPNGQMFQPKDGRELMDMANLMSTAGFMIKDIYRSNPGACMGLIAVCAPYGLNPLQVSWKTYQASKNPDAPIAYEAQVIVAMVNASGAVKGSLRYKYDGEGQSRRCCAYATLKGDTEPVEVWSPQLSQITIKNSPLWKTDPDQQLAYYSGRSWARRYKPEMLLGIYDVDELDGVRIGPESARDVTPKPSGFADLAMKARGETEDKPADAEVLLFADLPTEDAFPGSDAFTTGADAYAVGTDIESCPFDHGSQESVDWCGGWRGAERAAS